MDKKYHIKEHLYWLLWHKIPGFRNLSMDRQGEIVLEILEAEESLENIIFKSLELIGINKDLVALEAKKIVSDLENEGILLSGIFEGILMGAHKGLKFLEEEIDKMIKEKK
ncbi:hypothetical protein A2331_03485 [Candidatus Falkowbacteria bacterium RIFOXYB2_FULL_34_18]|uniref:Uncharacterized protein n=1 Tax=Candidatus Falkowbacteria bacterium RIFOXYD2_FULL_34_120 TaxID=1798007 RepID=A0A1F5TS76_9BACT|nr:MAG: hypothetical protein A2331_03485 [Candidatus Falkowbacteria bacterium RIFOXYB2_FULL_34_18]OGF30115.1 MAG: hypothetical protein A2500_04965 [Candidatus Falkowbacteria bacterium RIFOXYC12_FULL_34_55]OGF37551.1 MAG: hypothetical protein A2466_01880 [Candidatus Falkowbacteria bacterium RIFOXYC2_FULL_34_220]OGF39307.1 MAG: hypothetical protein A2515_02295 [Candidatus Falkowbacteria bacterium RIFOXYD12_FULL_34_57]OGF41812.1 MAG: hypothetical protein A2531_05280 [Candidatus Falkowbacteria bact